jgi:hypothetical protein
MRGLLFFLVCGVLPLSLLQAQPVPRATITGYVLDAQQGDTLVGVNVYVSGTTLGAATDAHGFFRIDTIPFGKHEIIASIIGYRREVKPLLLNNVLNTPLLFQLVPDTLILADVEVQATYPKDWQQNLRRFEDLFIGTMRFAKDCDILNPEVLDFVYEDDVLQATAKVPLEIENRALGYRITFYLKNLYGNIHSSFYSGQAFFTELTPKNEREAQRWRTNRLEAYRGSLRHFLTALVQKRLHEENFQLFQVARAGMHRQIKTDPQSILKQAAQDFVHVLDFPDALYVLYEGEARERGYSTYLIDTKIIPQGRNITGSSQYSWLTLNAGPVIFDTDGRLRNPEVLTRYAYWGWEERIAMMLPWDFDPNTLE